MDIRQRLFEARSYTPLPFLAVMILFARPTAASLLLGAVPVVTGEFLRLWGVAIAGSETRTTGPVGGTYLITKGPFAYVRNPLYLGNMLMYTGIGIMSNALFPWLALAALAWFALQYGLIVSLEEEVLAGKFGEEFAAYKRGTPRFIPGFRKYSGGTHEQPPLEWKSGFASERRTFQALGILAVVLAVLWQIRG